jgi:uncharacterized protein YfaS (alpha-2-macroglobulin family)
MLILLCSLWPHGGAVAIELASTPQAQPTAIPEHFLRRWDPITVFFADERGPQHGGAEDHPEQFVTLTPSHPGAYTWLDGKTLQFRPAEPWPALGRFSLRYGERSQTLTTVMEAPLSSIPADLSEGLAPVDAITLTFGEPLDAAALAQMVKIALRPLPGIDERNIRWLSDKDFDVKALERGQSSDPASYVLLLHEPIPSGMRASLQLRLGADETLSQTFKQISFSTQQAFRLLRAGCSGAYLPLRDEGVVYGADQALRCQRDGGEIEVEFSAELAPVTPLDARNFLRISPSVADLSYATQGRQLKVQGRFAADTVYELTTQATPLRDAQGRPLVVAGHNTLHFYFPKQPAQLAIPQGRGIMERYGPKMIPLQGRGFDHVDLRIYPIDPLDRSLWPFPAQPIAVDELAPPPGPGETLPPYGEPQRHVDRDTLRRYIKQLGSPPLSRIVALPIAADAGRSRFGLDLQPYLNALDAAQRPGSYLVGVRKLDGSAERVWLRVQVTDLALSTVEERNGVRFVVTSLSQGIPIAGASIRVEGSRFERSATWQTLIEGRTEADGSFMWRHQQERRSSAVMRIVVAAADDMLVLDPSQPGDEYTQNHWQNSQSTWLQWTQYENPQRAEQEKWLCHVFTDRPVYRPRDAVHIKGYLRVRHEGEIQRRASAGQVVVVGPNDATWRTALELSAAGSFYWRFAEQDIPTGEYRAYFTRDGETPCGSAPFRIEAYRLPQFEVNLHGPDQVPSDREFAVALTARYYAGGQVAERPVRWRVTAFPYAWTPQAAEGFYFSSDARYSGPQRLASQNVLSQEAQTDAQGSTQVAVNPATDPSLLPRSYIIEATVTGADDQTVTQTKRVVALPPFVLGLKTPRYLERSNTISPQWMLLGSDGKPIAEQQVRLRLLKREWHSYLRAADFTQGEAKYVTEVVEKTVTELSLRSGADVIATPLSLPGAGVYVIEIESFDRLGRAQRVAVDFFAAGDEPVTWSRTPGEVFRITPDKSRYEPGENARLVLESPFQQARALLIVEAPQGNQYQWLAVEKGAAEVVIPIHKTYTPQLPVHVLLMRGRVPGAQPAGGNAKIDLGKPATLAASVRLDVEPVEHQLNVTLHAPERAQPGERVRIQLDVKDRQGRPQPGEATLWLVDQAVLALGKEQRLDLLPDFISPVESAVALRDTRNGSWGWLPVDELEGGDQASAAAGLSLLDRATVRKNFQSVPFFDPVVLINAAGRAEVELVLPDNLTNFKIRAKVVSGDDLFGVATGALAVRLPVIVQPALPRFVRPTDEFTATAIARVVEGEGGAMQAQFSAQGLLTDDPLQRDYVAAANQPLRAEFAVRVPAPRYDETGEPERDDVTIKVAVQRQSDQARDAFEVSLPIRPDQRRVKQRALYDLTPGTPLQIPALSDATRENTTRQAILVSSQPGVIRLAAALDYLLEYPYGCTEQRLSRAQGFVALRDFSRHVYKHNADALLRRVVDETLAWLPTVTDEQGLVAFWPQSPGRVFLTAATLEFLVAAQEAGFAVDQALRQRLIAALQRALRSDYAYFVDGESFTERVMALAALSEAGHADAAYLAELGRRAEFLSTESVAEVLRLYYRAGNVPATTQNDLQKRLWRAIVLRRYQGKEIYGGLQSTAAARNHLVLPSEARTLASIVRATAASPSADPRLAMLVDGLVAIGTDNGWGSTNANTAALQALVQVLQLQPRGATQTAIVAHSEGTQTTLALGGETPIATWVRNRAPLTTLQSSAGAANGALLVRVDTSYVPRGDGGAEPSRANGFVVSREALHWRDDQQPPIRQRLASAPARIALQVGDVIEEHVEVVNPQRRNYVAISVPLAAGMEPLNPNLATAPAQAKPAGALTLTPSYVFFGDDELRYFYDELPQGTYHLYFRTRATVAGNFVQPPALAQTMYEEGVSGQSFAARVQISPANAAR